MGVSGPGVESAPHRPSRFDGDHLAAVEQRMDTLLGRWTPFAGLGIGLAATPLIVKDDTWVWAGVLPLSAALALWAWWFVGSTPQRA